LVQEYRKRFGAVVGTDLARELFLRSTQLPCKATNMGQQSRSCEATLDHARWRRRFDHTLAPGAAKLRPHMANYLEVSWDVLQYLGYILAEVTQCFTASGAAVLFWMMGPLTGRCDTLVAT
jgi:hypothetical protein